MTNDDSGESDDAESTTTAVSITKADGSKTLTRQEKWRMLFLVFSCVVASLTIVAGTGAVVIQSVGGTSSIAPFDLACFFWVMSLVSLTLTPWIFERHGRKVGFWCGGAIATGGAAVGCGGLYLESTPIVLMANVVLGAGTGIGMYLRFASIEIVPPEFASKAIAWTLCGGCLAAFVGPETAAATTGAFGNGNLTYLGSFILVACFSGAQSVFVGLIHFDLPPTPTDATAASEEDTADATAADSTIRVDVWVSHMHEYGNQITEADIEALELSPTITPQIDIESSLANRETANNIGISSEKKDDVKETTSHNSTPFASVKLSSLMNRSDFVFPLLVSILFWAIMAMPMSFFMVPMRDIGFTDRQSLTIVEFHFLAMYSPGFWTGNFIKQYGQIRACLVAIACFLLGTAINLSTQPNDNTTATWFLGLIFLGIGWNFGFASATMWLTTVYQEAQQMKAKVQAANDCASFFFSGSLIFSTGFLYNAGGGGLEGWRTLQFAIMGLILLLLAVVVSAMKIDRRKAALLEMPRTVNTKLSHARHTEQDSVIEATR